MKFVRSLAILVLAAILAPMAGWARPQNAAGANAQSEDDVREVVFRYQFKTVDLQVAFYFVSVDNKNPSPAFLDRFRDNEPIVRGASDAKFEKKPVQGFVEKHTEKQGILFKQDAIHWVSDTQADVQGGVECGDSCNPATGVYHVARSGNQWNVTSFDASKPHS